MPCYKPLTAWKTDEGQIVFAERGKIHSQLQLACGQCIGCRLERSRQWAIRCIHEAQMHKYNCFITLTYNDNNLPPNGSLNHRDFQLFFKRLRKSAWQQQQQIRGHPVEKQKIRYYMAGEYGENFGRPHFHACLFGLDFQDKKYITKSPTGCKLYTSKTLEKLWPAGYSTIGQLNFETAAYTARYVMKKITGKQQKKHYEITDQNTGEITLRKPEYNNMSRRPGIANDWLQKYYTDVYPHGKIVARGHKQNPPRYYNKIFKLKDPVGKEALDFAKYLEGLHHRQDQTPERLKVRETVAQAQIKQLRRKIK